ncbi:transcription factor Tfb4 [Rhizodiscina lignyota]|uniref:General transcription and DNA repair factor IIH subunit TFB4 n=1 Tax=Rhizodiscina lignyota TaxID=1504668 RepID=A0A9P4M1S4_9PEZI|nr:transcription factor Tfb4 [Rhizodiscina lignyota]
MNAIDGTDRTITASEAPPPSLLTIILDTNPYAWSILSSTLPLSKVIANLLVFINAHLAINHANQVAVIASHTTCAQFLYPTPKPPQPGGRDSGTTNEAASNGDVEMSNGIAERIANEDDANKYRPFRIIEQELLANLTNLISKTTPEDLKSRTTTMIAGALTTALAYINKQILLKSPSDPSVLLNADTSAVSSAALPMTSVDGQDAASARSRQTLTSRILILSVSGDLAAQYIPVMNTIFAAQRQRVPIDVLKLAGDTVFLQQACDSTGGIYLDPSHYTPPLDSSTKTNGKAPADTAAAAVSGTLQGLLLHLLHPLLPDSYARHSLVPPADAAVDFRAACFCHRRVVDIGYVCSVCLSIFCEPLADGQCLTCGTQLILPREAGVVPAVLPRAKKKKKKKIAGGADTPGTSSAAGTPAPS